VHAQQSIVQRFPGLEVLPSNYPAPKHKVLAAKALGYVQWGVMGAAAFGERLAPALGYELSPEALQSLKDKRFGVIACSWFFGNMASNGLLSTGAFEVYYDGQLVYSKLQTGQLPTMAELLSELAARIGAGSGVAAAAAAA
jgi:selT/selW/selH-like putative selenoprotein